MRLIFFAVIAQNGNVTSVRAKLLTSLVAQYGGDMREGIRCSGSPQARTCTLIRTHIYKQYAYTHIHSHSPASAVIIM